MKNFITNNLTLEYNNNIFYNVPKNILICINENKNSQILPQLNNIKCYKRDCSDNYKSSKKKIIAENRTCINNCENDLQNIYEYNGRCYKTCSNGYYIEVLYRSYLHHHKWVPAYYQQDSLIYSGLTYYFWPQYYR